MPIAVSPPSCPDCGEAFQLTYTEFRLAKMPATAKLVLRVGIVATIFLTPILVIQSWFLADRWTDGKGWKEFELSCLFIAATLISILIALLPGWLAWRFSFSRLRLTTHHCPKCRWTGTVGVADVSADPFTVREVPQVYRIVVRGDPVDEQRLRHERRLERERLARREQENESEPNPDFDFGQS